MSDFDLGRQTERVSNLADTALNQPTEQAKQAVAELILQELQGLTVPALQAMAAETERRHSAALDKALDSYGPAFAQGRKDLEQFGHVDQYALEKTVHDAGEPARHTPVMNLVQVEGKMLGVNFHEPERDLFVKLRP
jgi:hypothetical protein